MKVLVVHNSDEVKEVFTGETEAELLEKIKKWEDWPYLEKEIEENWDEWSGEEMDEEIPFSEALITLEHITQFTHDGDSSDGYTQIQPRAGRRFESFPSER